MSPEQNAAGSGVVGHADAGPCGELAAILPMPGANLPGVAIVWGAEGIDQSVDPRLSVGYCGAGTRSHGECDGFGSALSCDLSQYSGGFVQRFVPRNASPTRIWITLWSRAPHRVKQPVGRIDQSRRGSTLGTQRFAGWVAGVGLDCDEASVLNDGVTTAA
jgi:hypothetical protein